MSITNLKCWRWRPGMLDTSGFRLICSSLHDGSWLAASAVARQSFYQPTQPDLDDDATRGAVLFGILAPLGWEATVIGNSALLSKGEVGTGFVLVAEALEAALRTEG